MNTLTDKIAEWVVGFDLRNAPAEVVKNAKRSVIDTVGVALAGSETAMAERARRYVEQQYGAGRCRLIARERKLSSAAAAFANGVAAHALDFDDTYYPADRAVSSTHGSAVVLPAVLAAAEVIDASGEALLNAFIAGSETEYLLCRVVTSAFFEAGWFPTAALGVIGAAAGVAKVTGLSTRQTAAAIALAASCAANTRICLGSDVNPFSAGRAAEAGVVAADFARLGASAPALPFEGPHGFLQVYNHGVVNLGAIERLGSEYGLAAPGLWYKLYPVCTAAQAAAEATQSLTLSHDVRPEQLASVRCEVEPHVVDLLRHRIPSSAEEAQFSLPFAVACMLVYRRLTVAELDERTLTDAGLCETMRKVEMVARECGNGDAGTSGRTAITINLTNGAVLAAEYDFATGTPEKPLSDDRLEEKFMSCAAAVVSRSKAETLMNQLHGIEFLSSVRQLALA